MTGRLLLVICAATTAVAVGGCDDASSNGSPTSTVTITTVAPPGGEPTPTISETAGAPPAGEPGTQQWTMPNLVGMTVQQAQDSIQALTGGAILISTSHDATGKGRNQLLDANWKVCSQNVSAGAQISVDTRIDFGAVKLSETCP